MCKALLCKKKCSKNVGEIDTNCQFHQHLGNQLLRWYYFALKLQGQTVIREKLCKTFYAKKLLIKFWEIWQQVAFSFSACPPVFHYHCLSMIVSFCHLVCKFFSLCPSSCVFFCFLLTWNPRWIIVVRFYIFVSLTCPLNSLEAKIYCIFLYLSSTNV